MIATTNQTIKMFSVWYWTKRLFCKWVTVYAPDEQQAINFVEALPDFQLDSINPA